MPKKKMTKEDILKTIPDEKVWREHIALTVFAQHAMELTMLQKVGLEKMMLDMMKENLAHDIIGSTHLFTLYAEVYRIMVENGTIKPVDITKIAARLGMTPDKMLEMRKAGTEALKRGNLDKVVLAEDKISFDAMDSDSDTLDSDQDEIDKLGRDIMAAGLKKMRKDRGQE